MKQFSTLRNGARVLQQEGDVVLCEWDRGSHVDYVTWRVDQEGNAFWGHYARSLRVAAREFEARVAGR